MTENFKYEFDPDFDHIIEEKANTYMALRRVKWGDSKEFRLDLRKYQTTESGEERMLKGCTFISDEGAHELTRVMLEQGFGHPQQIVEAIKTREDIYNTLVADIVDLPEDQKLEIAKKAANEAVEMFYDMREVI